MHSKKLVGTYFQPIGGLNLSIKFQGGIEKVLEKNGLSDQTLVFVEKLEPILVEWSQNLITHTKEYQSSVQKIKNRNNPEQFINVFQMILENKFEEPKPGSEFSIKGGLDGQLCAGVNQFEKKDIGVVFFVIHNPKNKPYQHRFIQEGLVKFASWAKEKFQENKEDQQDDIDESTVLATDSIAEQTGIPKEFVENAFKDIQSLESFSKIIFGDQLISLGTQIDVKSENQNYDQPKVEGTFFQPFALNLSTNAQGGILNVLQNNGLKDQILELQEELDIDDSCDFSISWSQDLKSVTKRQYHSVQKVKGRTNDQFVEVFQMRKLQTNECLPNTCEILPEDRLKEFSTSGKDLEKLLCAGVNQFKQEGSDKSLGTVFFVIHEQEHQKPYQHRFREEGLVTFAFWATNNVAQLGLGAATGIPPNEETGNLISRVTKNILGDYLVPIHPAVTGQ